MNQLIQNQQSEGAQLQNLASCEGKTELFFSERTVDMRAAQLICASCPRRKACVARARQDPPFAGVWGGIIFVNGQELLTKRGRGRPRKSEQFDNARLIKVLESTIVTSQDVPAAIPGRNKTKQIA